MSKIERALRKAEEEKRKKKSSERIPDERTKNVIVTADGVTNTCEAQPELMHISEHFRKIATRLMHICENTGATDIIFTSAVSDEGKTTSAINCAISLCQDFNLSVCLVDCDLRNPTISHYFEPNGHLVVSDVLKGKAEIDSVIQPSPMKGLSIIHSRKTGRLSLPLLNTQRLAKIVQELRARFDFVIFDSPPVLPLADTVVLSKNVSGVVLVLESGKTRRKHIEQIFEQIGHEKVIGFIMNYKRHRLPEAYNYATYYYYGLEESKTR